MKNDGYLGRILPVRIYGDKVLRMTAEPIQNLTLELRHFIEDLKATMYEKDGVGLAAPQVGRSVRIFVIDDEWVNNPKKRKPKVFINPEIIKMEGEETNEEGCLSLPGIYESVKRAEYVEVKAMNEEGKIITYKATGLLARAIQHENDHLDGIVFTDHLPKLKLLGVKRKLKLLEKTTDKYGINILNED